MNASAGDELVDVVDRDGVVVDTVSRARMRADHLRHRAVSIAVIGSDGRLLIHRRADTKDIWPGWWDIAAGGVVSAGEHPDLAARRELAEELGVDGVELEPLGHGLYEDADVALVGHLYRCHHDGPFSFTDGEITEIRWVGRTELDHLMAVERFVPDNVALLLPMLALP